MMEALRLHIAANVTCLRRNRLLHAFGLLVAVGVATTVVPTLAFGDTSNRFEALRVLARMLHGATGLVTSGMGLFLFWVHRRGRSISMVATTAAPFGAWVAALFATGALVAVAAHAVIAVLVVALSQAWGVTYQYGFVYLALDSFTESMIALSIITTLSVFVHPVLTAVLVTLVNDSTMLAVRQGLELLTPGPFLRAVRGLSAAVYFVLPASDPFGERTAAMLRTMRVATSDWHYLGWAAAYAVLVLALAQVTTLVWLRRRPTL
jgi:hypothetical protein